MRVSEQQYKKALQSQSLTIAGKFYKEFPISVTADNKGNFKAECTGSSKNSKGEWESSFRPVESVRKNIQLAKEQKVSAFYGMPFASVVALGLNTNITR